MRNTISTLLLVLAVFVIGNLSSRYFNIDDLMTPVKNEVKKTGIQEFQQDINLVNNVPVPQAPQQPTFIAPIKQVGDSFVLWNIEYKVTSAKNYTSAYAKTTGKYIAVKIKATNIGKEKTGANKIFIKDSKERQYDPLDILAALPVTMGSSDIRLYGQTKDYSGTIIPGFSEDFTALFEVPKDATGLQLQYPSANGPVVMVVQLGI